MNARKKIPVFANLAEERSYWEQHDSTDFIDWSKAKQVRFPNLKQRISNPQKNIVVDNATDD